MFASYEIDNERSYPHSTATDDFTVTSIMWVHSTAQRPLPRTDHFSFHAQVAAVSYYRKRLRKPITENIKNKEIKQN